MNSETLFQLPVHATMLPQRLNIVFRKIKRWKKFTIIGSLCVISIVTYYLRISDLQLKPCKITLLDPWDDGLKPFLKKPVQLKCTDKYDFVYVDETGRLNFNHTIASTFNITIPSLRCTYQHIKRLEGDMKVEFQPKENLVTTPLLIKSHLFRVTCSNVTHRMYDMVHFNPYWNEYAKPITDIHDESESKLSVLIFGIDSVSRSHAIRNLPKSYKFLEKEFQSFDFHGYSKVGENTWPNLVPLLTGQSHRDFPLVEHIHIHADSMPILWTETAVQNMASYFAEDRPDISTFNFVKSGFKHVPTDFYFRPYTLAIHEFEPVFISPLGTPTWDCYGKRNYFDLQIDYLKGFLSKYEGKRTLSYFWSNEVGHEDFTTLSRGDESFLSFLKWLKYTNKIKHSILIVLSDHGFRIGGASLTHAGRAENNKPWLMIHIPKHILETYPAARKNIQENTQRLVSHYDTYQTVLDILNNKAFVKQNVYPVKSHLVRRNIFTPIPTDRTCADSGIEDKYCTCREKETIAFETPLARSLAEHLVLGINKILAKYSNLCSVVNLHNVTEVTVIYSNSDEANLPENQKKNNFLHNLFGSLINRDTDTGRYNVLFFTNPGLAYFEGTVDYSQYGSGDITERMTMIGEPSRLNRYGNQPHCIQDSFIKLFCYCIQQ